MISASGFLYQRSSIFAPALVGPTCQPSRMCVQVVSSTDVPAALLKTALQAAGGKLPRLLKSKAPGRGRRKVRECT